jgi:diguanylate cyclase
MKSFEILSDIIIETLQGFSSNKQSLTSLALCQALSQRSELSSLLPRTASMDHYPQTTASPPSLEISWQDGSIDHLDQKSLKLNQKYVQQVRDTYLRILTGLAPISRGEYVERSSELQRRIEGCYQMETLLEFGEDLVNIVRLLVSRAFEDIDHASDILSELGKDLTGMEAQLISYHVHNRETFRSNDKFTSHLLLDTEEISEAFHLSDVLADARGLISFKLLALKKAIERKRQEDEVRLQDADYKIDELKKSLQGYKEEVARSKQRADALEKEVLLDGLTEIHNRRAYELRIREEMKRFHREGQTFSLVLIDVDCFKDINDVYGHPAGDKCLQGIAGRIRAGVRATDFLARYGGEEFVVILAGSSEENARRIAEKIRVLIEKTQFFYRSEEIRVTTSLGVSEVRPTDEDPEVLFARVDGALYQAKKQGRNRVCIS